jgi:hypothetical protein
LFFSTERQNPPHKKGSAKKSLGLSQQPDMCRNLRDFSSDLMPFLQKRIIFADFCFESIGIAEIPAVVQQFPLTEETSQGKTVISQFFEQAEL